MTTENARLVIIMVSVPDSDCGLRIAEYLIKNRLAACVQKLPSIRSIYHWQDKIEQSEEELLIIKTRAELKNEVSQSILRLHPYEVPEIVCSLAESLNNKYLDWVIQETTSPKDDDLE